ncbi:MAG: tRNA1(Val) (adenine(37)-N6)-methyltransferase [Clostridiales bacterium]|nr:tRNA1(Val) (adenine(37)-N6)-methyltransferase [Clostridiales bacterium]
MNNKLDYEGLIKPGERIDELNRNNYRIIQNTSKFCFGMDAVLLTGFVKVLPGERLLDLGTGTGIIPILLEAKTKGSHFTGLEIQEDSADMARRSVALNGLDDKIDIITGDIKQASSIFRPGSFDVITSNPPYMNNNHGLINPNETKAIARHEILCTLEDVVREASRLLKMCGRFYLVHRPFRLVEIINTLSAWRLEPKRMRLVHPYIDKEPNMVLIEAVKGGKSMVKIEPPLIVYKEKNIYSDEIQNIYGF